CARLESGGQTIDYW
nr:immunoglobulin heavy chain junction region [Macaca mulatta]MOV46745.1 immunoglobulin heavy chain junction region [Macaca mulatta]